MSVRALIRTALVAVAVGGAFSAHAQDGRGVGFSGGLGAGASTEQDGRIALEISADWLAPPLAVSGRGAVLFDLLSDDGESEFALLAGPAWGRGRWSASAGAGVGLVWRTEGGSSFLSDRRPTEVRGPSVSLPLSAEVAYRVLGPAIVRVRGFASVDGDGRFWGTTLGWGARF